MAHKHVLLLEVAHYLKTLKEICFVEVLLGGCFKNQTLLCDSDSVFSSSYAFFILISSLLLLIISSNLF